MLLVIGGIIGFIIFCFDLNAWIKRNHNQTLTFEFLGQLFVCLLNALSNVYFWLLFVLASFWFIGTKGQVRINVVMFTSSIELLVLVVIAFVGKFFKMISILWSQTHMDVFFMDWEKPKGKLIKGAENVNNPLAGENLPVSVWRTLFAANEWNKLQTYRVVSIPFTLFAILFFMRGLNIESLATIAPASSDLGNFQKFSVYATSWVFRFFLSTLFWLGLSLIQIIFFFGIYFRYFKDPITQYADLMSVSNLSLFVLKEKNYGFYVHGRSVHANADTNMLGLVTALKREEENMAGTRGLLPNTETQTFKMFCTDEFREQVDKIYYVLLNQDLEQRMVNSMSMRNNDVIRFCAVD